MPATISATLSSAKPAAAAERPVKALRSEITTGMSAPPIGSTTRLPSTAAAIRMPMKSACEGSPLLAAMSTQAARMPTSSSALTTCWPGTDERPGRDQVLELGEGDVRAPEGDRADHRGEEDGDQGVERDLLAERDPVADLRPGDQRHGAAADAVVEGDHLRHLGHLHADRGDHADRRADPEAERDQPPVADPVEQQRGDDGDRHADRGDHVALLGGRRVGALFDADDEEREGDDVERRGPVATGLRGRPEVISRRPSSSAVGLRLRLFGEHAEHPVGDHEAADDVDRAEGDRDRADHVLERVVGVADDDQPAEHDDAVDRVGLRHQRRVQGRRHLRDHLEADEGGEDEDRDLGHQAHGYFAALSFLISPPSVMQAAARMSSSKSTFSSPSSATSRPSRFSRFLA